jgi:hypothetical protein
MAEISSSVIGGTNTADDDSAEAEGGGGGGIELDADGTVAGKLPAAGAGCLLRSARGAVGTFWKFPRG